MKDKTEPTTTEREFCVRTGQLAHTGCLKKNTKIVPKDRFYELCEFHKKLKISKKNYKIYQIMENKFKGEDGKYNLNKALEECEFIRKKICEDPKDPSVEDKTRLGRLLYRVKKQLEKRLLKELFPKIQTINRLSEEMENLIINDESLNKHTFRTLQRKYGLYGDNKDKIKKYWERKSEDINVFTFEGINQLRLFKKQTPPESRRKIERRRPFAEFNLSFVLAAKEKGIINSREVNILKYRYGLDGQGVKSLRLISGWRGISHTTVRNIETKALKKIKDQIEEIKKKVQVNKHRRREISKEEYKEKFGYYPDQEE